MAKFKLTYIGNVLPEILFLFQDGSNIHTYIYYLYVDKDVLYQTSYLEKKFLDGGLILHNMADFAALPWQPDAVADLFLAYI